MRPPSIMMTAVWWSLFMAAVLAAANLGYFGNVLQFQPGFP